MATWRHEPYGPGDFERDVLRHLDGTNDRPAILSRLMESVRAGALTVEMDGHPVPDPTAAEPLVRRYLEDMLARFVRYSLLVARAAG